MSAPSIFDHPVVTAIRTRPLPDPATPSPGANGQGVTFQALSDEVFNEREHHRIWRDDLIARGAHDHAAERQRCVNIYDALFRLIERVQDPQILARLRHLAKEEKERNAALDALPAANQDHSS